MLTKSDIVALREKNSILRTLVCILALFIESIYLSNLFFGYPLCHKLKI